MAAVPVTAIVLTKDEAAAIARSVSSLSFCDQVIVVDSASEDGTPELARAHGAEVINFTWNGAYPKKKQWALEHSAVKHDWVLMLDADEVITLELAEEIRERLSEPIVAAFDIPLRYYFAGKALRHGHKVFKRSLLDRRRCRFPEVGDLEAPGITEVEGHYQPTVDGSVGCMKAALIHEDPDPVSTWFGRHNRYSDWEAYLVRHQDVKAAVRGNRTSRGQFFDRVPFKPLIFFLYSYVYRRGFLDGRAGFDYAFALTWYYWSIGLKVREQTAGPGAGIR